MAIPVTYTLTATATGSLAGVAFADAPITVTSAADTSNVVLTGSVYDVIADSSTITIGALPTLTFTDPMFWEDPNGAGDIIFQGLKQTIFRILGFTHLFAGLETYDLKSSFGPVASPFDFETGVFNAFQNIPTSGGSLSLVASNDTFVAVAGAPEPTSFFLAGIVLMALFVTSRRLGVTNACR